MQTSTDLLREGKSTRLQKMREQALGEKNRVFTADADIADRIHSSADPQWLACRRLIDRRLADIFASLPAGKQQSLFRIRYGMAPGQLLKMPIRDIMAVLKLDQDTVSMKRMADVDYNGRPINQ